MFLYMVSKASGSYTSIRTVGAGQRFFSRMGHVVPAKIFLAVTPLSTDMTKVNTTFR